MRSNYKVIVVDDEAIVRNGLLNFAWEGLGFQTVGGAANGKKALDLIEKVMPEVVITDIKMPVMDGLELCRILHDQYPSIRVVILSGYKEFDYIKEALSYSVKDYLLKPIDLKELKHIFIELKKELDIVIKESNQLEQLMKKEEVFQNTATMTLLRDLVEKEDFEEVILKLSIMGVEFKGRYHASSVIYTEAPMHIRERFLYEIQKQMDKNHLGYSFLGGQYIVLICNFNKPRDYRSSHMYLLDCIKKLVRKAKYDMEEGSLEYIRIGVGNIYRNIDSMQKSYEEAIKSISGRFFNEDETLFYAWSGTNEILNYDHKYPYKEEKRIIEQLREGNEQGAQEYLEVYWEKLINSGDFKRITNECVGLFNLIDRSFYAEHMTVRNILMISQPYIEFLRAHDTVQELKNSIRKILIKVASAIKVRNNKEDESNYSQVILKAVAYIKDNYNQRLMLGDVADYVHLNPSYFSTLFKKEMTINYVDFLTEIRLNKAKELLIDTNYKVYEISAMVGFDNDRYFAELFKKVLSITPTQYRKSH